MVSLIALACVSIQNLKLGFEPYPSATPERCATDFNFPGLFQL